MIKSMTGYAYTKIDTDYIKANLIIKSWNSRFLDLSIQVPDYLSILESRLKNFVEANVGRGKVELKLQVTSIDVPSNVSIDVTSAKAIASAMSNLLENLELDDSLQLSHILGINGILNYERVIDTDKVWTSIEPSLNACFNSYNSVRNAEGKATEADLNEKINILTQALNTVAVLCPEIEELIKTNLTKRLKEVVGDSVDENRILTEVAIYLARNTINEEIIRLRAHIESFCNAMHEDLCGKKLDFICQEMNREANTIASKASDVRISEAIINMKYAIENMREQIRNVE